MKLLESSWSELLLLDLLYRQLDHSDTHQLLMVYHFLCSVLSVLWCECQYEWHVSCLSARLVYFLCGCGWVVVDRARLSVCQVTGHFVSVTILERVGVGPLCDQLLELVRRVRQLRLDANEYICLKYIILLNSGTHCHYCYNMVITSVVSQIV